MTWDSIQQLIRILMQIFSGWLIGQGYLTEEMTVTLTGGVLSLANVVWWLLWNRKAQPSTEV